MNPYWRELRSLVKMLSFKQHDEIELKKQKNNRLEFLTEQLFHHNDEVRLSASKALKYLDTREKGNSCCPIDKSAIWTGVSLCAMNV